MSARHRPRDEEPTRLWAIRAPNFEVLFCGTLMELAAELIRLKRERGIDAAAIEVRE